jgi:LytS/YehU family sensor histidine kinase
MTLVYAFLGLAAWYPCRAFPLARRRTGLLVATHSVAALVTSSVWVFLGAGIVRLLALSPSFAGLPARYAPQVPALFAAGVLLYLLSVALHYVLLAFEDARARERRESDLAILAREAELKALKAQLAPHFLFNSLNSIASLAGTDPARARGMCVSLSEFLRKSLAVGEKPCIRMRDELSLAASYLEVERVRFGERLAVEQEIEPGGEDCLIPPLLLQPLVENAVVHGIATLVEGGTVRVEARRAGQRLRIVVENPLDPDSPARPRGGLGLKIVRERLAAVYGGEALFAAKRTGARHLAVISIPVRASA